MYKKFIEKLCVRERERERERERKPLFVRENYAQNEIDSYKFIVGEFE